MSCVNKVILIGNVGRGAELRFTATGRPVANLSMATTENWKDNGGEWQRETQWHRVVIWGERAEALSNRLVKGTRIFVEGRLRSRTLEEEGGKRRYFTEVYALRVFPLSARGAAAAEGNEAQSAEEPADPGNGDPVPF